MKKIILLGIAGIGILVFIIFINKEHLKSNIMGLNPPTTTFTPLIDPQGFTIDLAATELKNNSKSGSTTEISPSDVTPYISTQTPALGTPIAATLTSVSTQGNIESTMESKATKIPKTTHPVETEIATEERTLLSGPIPWQPPGVELLNLNQPGIYDLLDAIGVKWVRHNGLLWSQVEPQQGDRKWEFLSNLEDGLKLAASRGMKVILVVRSTPPWAQKIPGVFCGAIKRGKFTAFADFMYDVVKRYSVPPYNVKYWELGNEPDVDPGLVPADNIFGCWGDESDPYYGGEYYAEMLKEVYPMIKLADPDANVLIGGLLLDCDPTLPNREKPCPRGKFLEGILQNNGGKFFDIVSYHAYPAYLGDMRSVLNYTDWEKRGGILMGKVDFIKENLAKYNQNKLLMNTETSFLCPEWSKQYCNPPQADFFEAQADYVPRVYARNLAAGVLETNWYAFDDTGWRYSSVINKSTNSSLTYQAYGVMKKYLEGTIYQGALNIHPGIEGFDFSAGDHEVWLLWSTEDNTIFIQRPNNFVGAFDKLGNSVQLEIDQIPIRRPTYILFSNP